MSFSSQIATSLFLAAAVIAAPQGSINTGASSVSFTRHTSTTTPWSSDNDWKKSYKDQDGQYRLLRRGEGYAATGRPSSSYRGAARHRQHTSSASDSDSTSDSDSDSALYDNPRPAFSRDVPTVAQLKHEAAAARHVQYGRLQRRSYGGEDDLDDGSDSDSYGEDYRQSLRRQPSSEYDQRIRRSNDYEDSFGSTDTPYADAYYKSIGPYAQRDYSPARHNSYDATNGRYGSHQDSDGGIAETDTDGESMSEYQNTGNGYDSSDDYGSGNGNQFNGDHQYGQGSSNIGYYPTSTQSYPTVAQPYNDYPAANDYSAANDDDSNKDNEY